MTPLSCCAFPSRKWPKTRAYHSHCRFTNILLSSAVLYSFLVSLCTFFFSQATVLSFNSFNFCVCLLSSEENCWLTVRLHVQVSDKRVSKVSDKRASKAVDKPVSVPPDDTKEEVACTLHTTLTHYTTPLCSPVHLMLVNTDLCFSRLKNCRPPLV